MRRSGRQIALFLGFLLMLGLVTGCSGGGEPDKEAVFTKTIHDFDGQWVNNLDQQEDTNFIVYAEGVQEIAMTDEVNVLTQRDDENFVYQFSNADETLLAMERGDVFFGVTERCEVVCVKVVSLQVDGASVVIQGEEMSLSDLFTYVDICMDIDSSQFYVDPSQIPEDCTVEYVGLSAGVDHAAEPAFLSAAPLDGAADPVALAKVDAPVGLSLSTKVNIQKSAVTVESQWMVVIRSVTVEFRYSDGVFFSSFVVNSTLNSDLSASGEGALVDIEKALANIDVPVGGPILGEIYPFGVFSVSGEIEVGVSSSQDISEGFAVTAGAKSGLNFSPVQKNSEPVVTPRLEEISGKLRAGMKFKVAISCLKLADIYGTAFGGLELEGSYDLFEAEKDRGKDSVHDCKACIAGEASLVGRITAGAELCMLPGNRLYQSEWTIGEASLKLCDFYVSFGASGGNETEFGWDKTCPHRRYLVTVTVLDQDGDSASGAAVTARYPDGRTESATADGGGQAEFYLPVGDNSITASRAGQKGSVSVMVTDQTPITALMRLEDSREIFIDYYFFDLWNNNDHRALSTYPELYNLMRQQYPDAVWIENDEWLSHTETVLATGNYSLAGMQEAYGLSPGDIIVYVCATELHNQVGSYNSIYLYTGIALLPEDTEENADTLNIPSVIWTNQLEVGVEYSYAEWFNTTDLGRVYYDCTERIYQGLEYDENYRITDIGTGWSTTEWEDEAPNPGTIYSFESTTLYQPLIAPYAARAFPYIDLLLADDWEDLPDEGDAAGAAEENSGGG